MYLGIEIGGTKLQLGVGTGVDAGLVECCLRSVERARGAAGILDQIRHDGSALCARHEITAIGVGFGGPVAAERGLVVTSHQVGGWDNFALADWMRRHFGVPSHVGNDCNLAALAEATWGAGRGQRRVFYVTVGTGIGGGFVIDGCIDGEQALAAAEIGHLRPGLECSQPEDTVESRASGPGLARAARQRIAREPASADAHALLAIGRGNLDQLTGKTVAQAARLGNPLAQAVLDEALRVLGWAIAQTATLLAPSVVIVGGGVSSLGETHFLRPLRRHVARFVFPPLRPTFSLVAAGLGEQVVVHGALRQAWLRESGGVSGPRD
jgi:glucokinase